MTIPHANLSKIPTMSRCLLSVAVASSLATASIAHASEYSTVTFFGDSLTDGGFFSPITQGNLRLAESGQFTGQISNTAAPYALTFLLIVFTYSLIWRRLQVWRLLNVFSLI
ncbi:hypothetical protein [uncultured Psychrobacter sp.]|uniref:hypothetical protein n=1 Tax=uncultured Psychrobacter sp. TaxID=259303 RepID=UPI00260385D8|nr:hypothetical protein [uncultured Psychrobacter sp.]